MNKETIEGNKLIAEFMGCQIDKDYATMHVWIHGDQTTMFYCEWHPELKIENERIIAWEFAPHENWCQLIPIVEKMQSLEKGKWYDKSRGHNVDIWLTFQKIDITDTYKKVILFIQWYNSQSKTKTYE